MGIENPEQERELTREEVVSRLEEKGKELFLKVGWGPSETPERQAEIDQLMKEAGDAGYLAAILRGETLWGRGEGEKPPEPADLLKVLEEKVAAREDIKAGRRRDTRWAKSTPVEEEIERFQEQIRILKEAAGL